MADAIDNRLIAAHLAAAMISVRMMPATEAVEIYNEVLAVLNLQSKSEKTKRAEAINEWTIERKTRRREPAADHRPSRHPQISLAGRVLAKARG